MRPPVGTPASYTWTRADLARAGNLDKETLVADTTQDNRRGTLEPLPLEEVDGPPGAQVREDDLEPHAGLRYVARLFKMLAVLLILLLIGEVVVGLTQEGPE